MKEMKEVVPFDRVFLAPPSGTVKDSDYLSYQDYEKISGIRVNNAVLNKQNKELYRKWQEANGIAVAPAETVEENAKVVKENAKVVKENAKTVKENAKTVKENAKENMKQAESQQPSEPQPSSIPSSVEDAKEVAASNGATL